MKALKAQAENRFQDQIAPIEVEETYLDLMIKFLFCH
ncbi:hypothetical protein OAC31_01630 [Polaribacter sp.]|nr:hypothetical protein [Polaribacter sp.]